MDKAVKHNQFENEEEELQQLKEDIANQPQDEESEEDQQDPTEDELAEGSAPPEDESEDQPEGDDQTEESDDESAEKQVPEGISKRGKNRFQELANKVRDLEQEKEGLLATVNALQQAGYSSQQAQDIAPTIDMNGFDQMNTQQIEQSVRQQARQEVSRVLTEREQSDARKKQLETFNEDLQTIEESYPVLNQDSEQYDPELDLMIGDYYEAVSQRDPNVRLKNVVDQFMAVRNRGVEQETRKNAEKIASKASKQALTPTGDRYDPESSLEQKLNNVESEEDLEAIKEEINKRNLG